jgi:ankyrin repeat protein
VAQFAVHFYICYSLLEIDFSDTEDDIHRMFHECEADSSEGSAEVSSLDVTPIMVACDQGNTACLEYMLEKFVVIEKTKEHFRLKLAKRNKLKTLLGNPLSDISTSNHNAALHHAAMAGCTPAIQLLQKIQTYLMMDDKHCQEVQETRDKGNQDERAVNLSIMSKVPATPIYLLLGSTRNIHNDTPLMMATQSTHALLFVETWYGLALKELMSMGSSLAHAEASLQGVLQAKNNSGDSCLSLACSHGRVGLVKFLVGEQHLNDEGSKGGVSGETQPISHAGKGKVNVTADEVYKCKGSFQRMQQALNCSPELQKQYHGQRDDVGACLKMLEAQLEFLSERVTRELLLAEEEGGKLSQRTDMAAKPKRKKKKKTKGRGQCSSSTNAEDDNSEPSREATTNDPRKEEEMPSVVLKTLPDGKTAVQVKGRQDDDVMEKGGILRGLNPEVQSQDASAMFRERFKGISDAVDSVMSALCLDVKCLLYSDHGMALNLSPAQLDAVQQILEKQLESVKKARNIQQRMHETGAGSESKQGAER